MLQITRDITQPLGFEPFIAPEGWTSPDQYAQFGNEVNIYAIFCAYQHPNKAYAYTFSDAVATLTLATGSYISYCYGYTVGGIEYRYEIVGGTIDWTGKTKRWVIVNRTDYESFCSFPGGAITVYVSSKIKNLGGGGCVSYFVENRAVIKKVMIGYSSLKGALLTNGIVNFPPNCVYGPSTGQSFGEAGIIKVIYNNIILSIPPLDFYDAVFLKEVILPNALTTISSAAFNGCVSLKNITFPTTITSIGSQAFYRCSSLTSFIIPPNIAENGIGEAVISGTNIPLENISSLSTNYYVGTSDKTIYGIIFSKTSSLIKTCIGTSFLKNGDIDFQTDTPTLERIGNSAFEYCNSILSITLPASLTSIGANAFQSCGITSLTLPNSLTSIGA